MATEVGRDLDIRVAEDVMGCKFARDRIFGDIQTCAGTTGSEWMPLQHYSKDKSAALSILERLEKYHLVKVDIGSFEGRWEVNFRKGRINYYYPDLRATSFPEAICKAALLAMLEKKNSSMTDKKGTREELLNSIIKIELDMFQRVRTAEPDLYQDSPEAFKVMREMAHSVLSDITLGSYLEDLQKAKNIGRNLITEKRARMDNKIPPLKTNPVIGDIVKLENRWIGELSEKYPLIFKEESSDFNVYLPSELETYSDKTLELYFRDVSKAEKEGRNLAEERYTKLFQQMSYNSIAEVEEKARK